MRKLMLAAALACGTAACAQGGDRSSLTSAASPPAESERIVVGAQSNVCVSVQVDQRIWPTPLDADADRGFSGVLTSALERLHQDRGGSYSLPGTSTARYFADANGTNPYCQDRDSDVFVEVRYGPLPDGGPFVMEYRIRRGAAIRTSSVRRDLAEELRTGLIVEFANRAHPFVRAIYDDIRARAPMIADQMRVER